MNLSEVKQQINERKNQLLQHLTKMQADIESFRGPINNNQTKALQLQISSNLLAKNTELKNEVIADSDNLPSQVQDLFNEQKSHVQIVSDLENNLRLFAQNQGYNRIMKQVQAQNNFLKELEKIHQRVADKLDAGESPGLKAIFNKKGSLNEQEILTIKKQLSSKSMDEKSYISEKSLDYLLLELKNINELINKSRENTSPEFQNALNAPAISRPFYAELKKINASQNALRNIPEFKDAHYAYIFKIENRILDIQKSNNNLNVKDVYALVELMNEILETKYDPEIPEHVKPAGIIAFIEKLTQQYPKAFEITNNKLLFQTYAYNNYIENQINELINNTFNSKELKIAELKMQVSNLIIGEMVDENRLKSPVAASPTKQGKNYIDEYKNLLATLKSQQERLSALNLKLTYGFLKDDTIKNFADNAEKNILNSAHLYSYTDEEKADIEKRLQIKLASFNQQILNEYNMRTEQINFNSTNAHANEIQKLLTSVTSTLEEKIKNNAHISKAEFFEAENLANSASIDLQLTYLEEKYESTMKSKAGIEDGIKERYETQMECIVMNETYKHQWEAVMRFMNEENPHFIPHPNFINQLSNPNSSQSQSLKLIENYQRTYHEILFWIDKIINYDLSAKKDVTTQTTPPNGPQPSPNPFDEIKESKVTSLNPFDELKETKDTSLNPFNNDVNNNKPILSSNPFANTNTFVNQSYQQPEQIYEAIDPQHRYQVAVKYFKLLKDSFDGYANQLQGLINTESNNKNERQVMLTEITNLIKEMLDKFALINDTKNHKGIKLMQNFSSENANLEANSEGHHAYLSGLAAIAAQRVESAKGIFRQGMYKLKAKTHDEKLNRYYTTLESLGAPNLSNQALKLKFETLKELNNVLNSKPEIMAIAQERKNNNVNNKGPS